MAENVGGIVWTASIETQQLVNGERQINQSTNRAGRNFDNMERKATGLNTRLTQLAKTLAGVFAVRQIQRFTMETIRAVDEQNKFAQSISVSFQELQKLQFAAEQNGASINEFNNSLRRLARRTEEAARGTGAAVQAFENLGLNARELESLSPDQIFLRVADSFQALEGSGKEVSTAFGLFDTEGAKLINTLRQGSAGIRELGDEAERSGRIISQQTAEDAAKFNDELNKLQGAAKGAAVSLGAELVPAMTDLMSATTDWLSTGNNAENLIKGIGIAAQATAVVLAGRFVGALVLSINTMNGATFAAKTLRFALSALGGPVGIIAGVAAGMVLLSLNARKAEEDLQNQELQVGNLTAKYKELDKAQRDSIRTSIEQQRTAALARIAQLEEIDVLERAQQARRASGGDVRGRRPSQDRAAGEREINELIERQNRLLQRLANQEAALNAIRDQSNDKAEESTEATNRGSESFEELRDTLVNAQRELQSTNDEWEEYQVLQKLGADATKEQREEILALLAGMRQLREEEEARRNAEAAAERLNNLTEEIRLLEIKNALGNDEYEREAAIAALGPDASDEDVEKISNLITQLQDARFEAQLLGKTLEESFRDIGLNALDDFSSGLARAITEGDSLSDTIHGISKTILTELLGSIIRYWAGQAAAAIFGQKAAAGAAIVGAGAATAAWTAPATLASIATLGGAAGIGVAAVQGALATSQGLTALSGGGAGGAMFGGARQYGGPAEPGKAYRVNETEPEMFISGGHQYLMPNMRGEVMNSKQVGGGDVNVSIRVNNNAPGVDVGVREQGSGNNRQFILDVVKADINNYGQSTVGALSTVTNIKRKTQ